MVKLKENDCSSAAKQVGGGGAGWINQTHLWKMEEKKSNKRRKEKQRERLDRELR